MLTDFQARIVFLLGRVIYCGILISSVACDDLRAVTTDQRLECPSS
ncbi:hypothetical protein [Spirosoma lituiforme]